MRQPRREHGRYASLSGYRFVKGRAGDLYELIVVDRTGLPVMPLTVWYDRRMAPSPNRTRDTYLGMLCPVFAYLADRGWAWDAPPERVHEYLIHFLRDRLRLTVHPDTTLDGYLYEPSKDTPLSDSSLNVLRAALRDFYGVMREAGYYLYGNPMVSDVLVSLKRERARLIAARGAPDYAGIRGETQAQSAMRPTNVFRTKRARPWTPNPHAVRPNIIAGINAALTHVLTLPTPAQAKTARRRNVPILSARDRAIFMLLRYTGARVSEIVEMSVGGYRSHTRDGVAGQAVLVDKGSHGREIKIVTFVEEVTNALLCYLRDERPRHDRHGRRSLSDLEDGDPFFLTEDGTPYTYPAFYKQWRRIRPGAQTHCPIPLKLHSIRHLVVTELLLRGRQEHGKGSTHYLDLKVAISGMMGWRSPQTIDAYDHSLDELDAIALLHQLQTEIGAGTQGTRGRGDHRPAAPDRPVLDGRGQSAASGTVTAADAGGIDPWFKDRMGRPSRSK